jgi:hypothetical protein
VKGDVLDDTGDFLGDSPALWDCGIHLVWDYFAMEGRGLGDLLRARFPVFGPHG